MSLAGNKQILEEIIKARVQLLFEHPFFGSLVTRLNPVDATNTSWCKTAATDGKNLYYNANFVSNITRDELKFLICHEILHCLYNHIGRRGNRDKDLYNMASDYVVNYTLKKNKIGSLIAGTLYDERYTDEMTSEEVYELLKQKQVKIEIPIDFHFNDVSEDGSGTNSGNVGTPFDNNDDSNNNDGEGEGEGEGGNQNSTSSKKGKSSKNKNGPSNISKRITVTVMGDEGPPVLTEDDLRNIKDNITDAAISAAQEIAQSGGSLPAGIARIIAKLTEPKISWKQHLDHHIRSQFKGNYSFKRPSRKSYHLGYILPGREDQQKIEVTCAIDNSASMTEEMIRDLLSEVKGIATEFGDFEINVFCFDTKIYNHVVFTPDNIDEIEEYEAFGGGGTLFECIWDHMIELDHEPKKLIVFTDGYPNSTWGNEHYCDTIFLIHGSTTIEAPFGTTVYYEE